MIAINPDSANLELAATRRAFVGSVKSTRESQAFDWFAPMSSEDPALWYGDSLPLEADGLPR